MLHGLVFAALLVLAAVGVRRARRLVKSLLKGGAELYVICMMDGRELVYKRPGRAFAIEDAPLEEVPSEIYNPEKFETYYNVCWFTGSILELCGHSYHATPEAASYCKRNSEPESFIGKVLEER